MTEYLISGANGWCINPDFRKAYTKWRYHASHYALKTPKEVQIVIYQVDTTNLKFDEGKAPVWIDGMGFNTHWEWKEGYEYQDGDTPLQLIYLGSLTKAPKTNVALEKFLKQ